MQSLIDDIYNNDEYIKKIEYTVNNINKLNSYLFNLISQIYNFLYEDQCIIISSNKYELILNELNNLIINYIKLPYDICGMYKDFIRNKLDMPYDKYEYPFTNKFKEYEQHLDNNFNGLLKNNISSFFNIFDILQIQNKIIQYMYNSKNGDLRNSIEHHSLYTKFTIQILNTEGNLFNNPLLTHNFKTKKDEYINNDSTITLMNVVEEIGNFIKQTHVHFITIAKNILHVTYLNNIINNKLNCMYMCCDINNNYYLCYSTCEIIIENISDYSTDKNNIPDCDNIKLRIKNISSTDAINLEIKNENIKFTNVCPAILLCDNFYNILDTCIDPEIYNINDQKKFKIYNNQQKIIFIQNNISHKFENNVKTRIYKITSNTLHIYNFIKNQFGN